MVRFPRKRILVPAFIAATYCIGYFSWNQAALAWAITGQNCSQTLIESATARVDVGLERKGSKPVILCSPKPDFGLRLEYGQTRIAPFLPTIITIGPKGTNVDVVAHEIAHARIADNLGALLRYWRLPVWLDEGLAMQFDNRQDYSREALKEYLENTKLVKPQLVNLESAGEFYLQGNQGKLNYSFAKCVVEVWREDVVHSSLLALFENINWLNTFPVEQFAAYEHSCLQNG